MITFDPDSHARSAGAYVHVPFCSAVCPYCDFAVVAGADHLVGRYTEALAEEIERSTPWRPFDAVYFGGGTPSHIEPGLLIGILWRLDNRHGVDDRAEITLEANPEDFSEERARALRSAGFNRVSFGAQSFDVDVLAALGRRHDDAQIDLAVHNARAGGFDNVSVDMIYGTPGETDASWEKSLRRAIDQEVDHVSCYALTVERGTPLGRAVASGAEGPDPDVQADRYAMAQEILEDAGFARYEVSNWARPGHECRYNSIVWAQGEYEAFGNGAHGFRDGVRFRNRRRVEAYLESIESGGSARAGEEDVQGWAAELDRLFVGLRRAGGVARGPGTDALVASDEGQRLIDAGVIATTGERLFVAKPLMTDAVHRSVLSLSAPIVWAHGDA